MLKMRIIEFVERNNGVDDTKDTDGSDEGNNDLEIQLIYYIRNNEMNFSSS